MNATTLLELVRPPVGYRTERAVWLTHDLDTLAATEHVLPALAGVVTPELGRRLASLGTLPAGVLTVVYAADRVTSPGFTSGQLVRWLPVLERRQHAKLVVLRYESEPSTGGARVIWRTVVTSANLTLSGLRSNREVWVVDEIASNDRRAVVSYLPPAVTALRELATSQDVVGRTVLRDSARALAKGLPEQLVDGSLTHSLKRQAPVIVALGSGPFRRLMLCAPTFAGRDASLAEHVRRLLAPRAQVDVVVPLESARAATLVPVPLGLIQALDAAGHPVTAHASRLFDRDGRSRRLHGKQYIGVHPDGTAEVVIGSANLTARGLLGTNRELVVSFHHPDGDQLIRSVLDELDCVRPTTTTAATGVAELEATVRERPAPIFPFTPDPGSSPVGRMRGRLGKHLGHADVTAARVDGLKVHPPTRIWLGRESAVEAKVDGTWVPAVVHIRCTDEAGFWASVERDDRPPQADDLLRQLLTDLQRVRDARDGPPESPTTAGGPDAGRFDIPQILWLNLVTRHRRRLPPTYPELQRAVHSRLSTPAERQVATAVLRTQPDIEVGRGQSSSPLLDALTAHLRYLDRQDSRREPTQ